MERIDAKTAAVLKGAEKRLRRLSKRRDRRDVKQAYRAAASLVHTLATHGAAR